MKKLRTYGKKSGREIYINVGDQFDCISDDSCTKEASPTWVKAFSTKGWCQPTRIFPSDHQTSSSRSSFDNEEKTNDIIASTPCSSAGAKLRGPKFKTSKHSNLQKQIFQKETISEMQYPELHEKNTDVNALEDLDGVIKTTKRQFISPTIESPIDDIDTLSFEMSNHLHLEQKISRPENDESPSTITVQGKSSFSIHTPGNLEMTFLEALTPYQLKDVNENRRTFSIDQDCTPLSKVLSFCEQDNIMDINDYFATRNVIRKIGEGVYGEVFELADDNEYAAIKVVPVEDDVLVNGESQKSFTEMLSEIAVSRELTSLSAKTNHDNHVNGFIKLIGTKCCRGTYPTCLLDHWEIWNLERGSENDKPNKFKEEQMYVLLEVEVGGTSLEDYRKITSAEAKSILHQVTAALAVGERVLKFEHRDLHWGNVLIKETKKKTLSYNINGETRVIHTTGIEVKIIDFTISRLEKDGCVVFSNLSDDESLFEGVGDYQFDVYRMMREQNRNCWYEFHPKSNVLWIHYLADKLCSQKLIRQSKKLRQFCNRIFEYQCAVDILNDDFFIR